MKAVAQFRWADYLWFVVIVALAGGTRGWYVYECLDSGTGPAPFVVQQSSPPARVPAGTKLNGKDNPTEMDHLIHNLNQENGFTSIPPLANEEVETAHIAPGYPWMVYLVSSVVSDPEADDHSTTVLMMMRLLQCVLGAVTAGLYFVFARAAFRSLSVALLAGTLCALNPFGIINCGELSDGVLTSFLLAVCLVTGTHAGKSGGPVGSLVFGLSLAGTALVRAAMLPFAFVGLLWFVGRCRNLQRGWLCGLLAVLGFANGMAPWTVRNYQVYGDILPLVDSAHVHLWLGNNPEATGIVANDLNIESTLPEDRQEELFSEPSQPQRYAMLAEDTLAYVKTHPTETVKTRAQTTMYFFLGRGMFSGSDLRPQTAYAENTPGWLVNNYELILASVLLGMMLLGVLGWRWSYASARNAGGLGAVAVVWVALPYILSHVEPYWGPRLPLDGILLSYCAVAVMSVLTFYRSPSGTRTA